MTCIWQLDLLCPLSGKMGLGFRVTKTLNATLTLNPKWRVSAWRACMQGVWLRDYEPMPQRKALSELQETLGAVPPSNAYRRRVAGVNWA